jgi:L-asparaginase
MKILFIQTGGTIDKDYLKAVKGYNFEITEPAVKKILADIAPTFDYEILPLLQKDSLDMTDNDRKLILNTCKNSKYDKIIITHGTDTMTETAKALGEIQDKTIVITGAARPERLKNSDAAFNLGTAIGAVGLLHPGVYISMNGVTHGFDKVEKDQISGQFVATEKGL